MEHDVFHAKYFMELPWKTSCSMEITWSIPREILHGV